MTSRARASSRPAPRRCLSSVTACLPQVFPSSSARRSTSGNRICAVATIIGAVGAGGIGLKLWEAMRTNNNWANVFYMVLLILLVVFMFDTISNRLRRRLVGDLPT